MSLESISHNVMQRSKTAKQIGTSTRILFAEVTWVTERVRGLSKQRFR